MTFSAFGVSFKLSKEQKVVRSCKSSIKGNLKVGFQLFLLSITFNKGVSSYKRDMKARCRQLFNFLLQLSKAEKGSKGRLKEHHFFLMLFPLILFLMLTLPYLLQKMSPFLQASLTGGRGIRQYGPSY